MDIREDLNDPEEAFRAAVSGIMKGYHVALPVIVHEDSKDGHVVTLKSAVRATKRLPSGKTEEIEYPPFQDVPIKFAGGGGATFTHPVKKGDEGFVVFASRAFDAWFQNGGVQGTIENRIQSLSDGFFIPGARSTPRKLENWSKDSVQLRSNDGKHFVDLNPSSGVITTSVDGGKHKVTVDPAQGVAATSDKRVTSSVDGGQHAVSIDKTEGVHVASSSKVKIDAPDIPITGNVGVQGLLGAAGIGGIGGGALNTGGGASSGIGAGAMQTGAAAANVGTLGGDLSGSLPNPNVVGCHHITDANTLPTTPGASGSLYVYDDGTRLYLCVSP